MARRRPHVGLPPRAVKGKSPETRITVERLISSGGVAEG